MKKYNAKEIEAILEQQIRNGELIPNDRLPSERELMDTFNVSRTTIRTIIAQLNLKRLVYRIPDKGVFVEREIVRKANRITGFTEMIQDSNRTPHSEIIFFDWALPEAYIAATLNLPEDQMILKLVRKRYVDGQPFLYETNYLHPDLNIDPSHVDFESQSMYDMIEQHTDSSVHYLNEIVSAVNEKGDIPEFLYRKKQGFVLKVEGLAYTQEDQLVSYGISCYHADRFSFESTILNQG